MWEMVLCIGMFLGMCGQVHIVPFPDEAACYRALEIQQRMGKAAFSYCRLKTDK